MAKEMEYDTGMELGELDKSWSSAGANVKTSKYNTGSDKATAGKSNGKGKGKSFGKY